MKTKSIEIGDVVEFQLIADGLLNSSFKRCTYQGNIGYLGALALDASLNDLHNAYYPYFKEQYPDYKKPGDYSYLLFTLSNGQLKPIGLPWILDGTFNVDSNRSCVITIHNYRGMMESPLRDKLAALGADYSYDVKTN